MKKVVLLCGGWSAEREVSLNKGRHVDAALKSKGYDVQVLDPNRDLSRFIQDLQDAKPDVVFNNLHGKWGEDGNVQGILNTLSIPYTHSGVYASAVGMDKRIAKDVARGYAVDVPEGVPVDNEKDIQQAISQWGVIVVKPCSEGSSIETTIIRDNDNRVHEIGQAITAHEWDFMAEEYIKGKELTVAVLDGKAVNVTEIIAATDFFDYEAKYQNKQTRYVMPADIPKPFFDRALSNAETIYKALGCRGLARCDFRFDDEAGRLCFLEINTQPGLTAESIAPSQLVAAGISFEDLCAHLVESAKCD